jgi:hypothetical protein
MILTSPSSCTWQNTPLGVATGDAVNFILVLQAFRIPASRVVTHTGQRQALNTSRSPCHVNGSPRPNLEPELRRHEWLVDFNCKCSYASRSDVRKRHSFSYPPPRAETPHSSPPCRGAQSSASPHSPPTRPHRWRSASPSQPMIGWHSQYPAEPFAMRFHIDQTAGPGNRCVIR